MIEMGRAELVALVIAASTMACSGKALLSGGDAGASGTAATAGNGGSNSAGSADLASTGSTPNTSVAGANAAGAGAGAGAGGVSASAAGAGNSAGSDTPSDLGVPLKPVNGWVDVTSNALNVQGAIFAAADDATSIGMKADFMSTNACIAGIAARVDMASEPCLSKMFTPPATDCFGQFWGASITLNLNQVIDPLTMLGATPAPFNASALRGFAFELSGTTLPPPVRLHFQVESADQTFCNIPSKKLKLGSNTLLFSELVSECFRTPVPTGPTAETVQSALVLISWHVVTNDTSTVPFDFCVSNIRGLLK